MHDNAWVYDLEIGGYTGDLAFWRSLVQERKATRILDLACGTGRITFAAASFLAESTTDFRVVGLDNSPPLLEAARTQLNESTAAIRDNVEFREGDMVSFHLEEEFDLILIGFNSLMYIIGQENQLACLRNVRKHLAPGGVLAFDILVPALDYLSEAQRMPAVRLELDLADPGHGIKQFLRFSTERYDAATQVPSQTIFTRSTTTTGDKSASPIILTGK